jgi:copper ion binding protein
MDKVFTVDGMHCQHCAMAVKKSLMKVSGVSAVDVNLETKSVKVSYDSNQAELPAMAKAIEAAGYKVVA